jgi:hypothetical protein
MQKKSQSAGHKIDIFLSVPYTANIVQAKPAILSGNPILKEVLTMNTNANKCIECTVQSCAYHCDTENYCSLDRILVGTHEANPAMDQCTDCKSFRKR